MMYGTYRLQYLHNTKHKHHPLPSPPLLPSPPRTKEKGYFDVHLPEKAFPFYTYIPEVRIRVKSVAIVSIIRFFAWQEEEFAKKRKKRGNGRDPGRQAGRFYKGTGTGNIIQYRYRYIVRMFKFFTWSCTELLKVR